MVLKIDEIKLIAVNYLFKILNLLIEKNYKLNPCELVKAIYIKCGDPHLHQMGDKIINLVGNNRYVGGFSLEYMKFYRLNKVILAIAIHKPLDNNNPVGNSELGSLSIISENLAPRAIKNQTEAPPQMLLNPRKTLEQRKNPLKIRKDLSLNYQNHAFLRSNRLSYFGSRK